MQWTKRWICEERCGEVWGFFCLFFWKDMPNIGQCITKTLSAAGFLWIVEIVCFSQSEAGTWCTSWHIPWTVVLTLSLLWRHSFLFPSYFFLKPWVQPQCRAKYNAVWLAAFYIHLCLYSWKCKEDLTVKK